MESPAPPAHHKISDPHSLSGLDSKPGKHREAITLALPSTCTGELIAQMFA